MIEIYKHQFKDLSNVIASIKNRNYKFIIYKMCIRDRFVIPQWDFAIGEGSDVIGTFHYYVIGDPFTFLCFLFPAKYMYIFYEAMILLRIYQMCIRDSCRWSCRRT